MQLQENPQGPNPPMLAGTVLEMSRIINTVNTGGTDTENSTDSRTWSSSAAILMHIIYFARIKSFHSAIWSIRCYTMLELIRT